MTPIKELPLFICGPLLRRVTPDRVVLWWISPHPVKAEIIFFHAGKPTPFLSVKLIKENYTSFQFGSHAWVNLADIHLDTPFPTDCKIEYEMVIFKENRKEHLTSLVSHITYPGQSRPSFVVRQNIRQFFHGSCRKPHHDSDDAFVGLDGHIEKTIDDMDERPALLMLTGDQIYADDVAGPMLRAIHQVIAHLGIYDEIFDDAVVEDGKALYGSSHCYYLRKKILPRTKVGKRWYRRGGAKHIFSSGFAHNHMITFGEWMAMYILVWSPAMWKFITLDYPQIQEKFKAIYEKERQCIASFKQWLPRVQRLLAHIPSYMIFDDHDITDDWNLTARWEARAYGNPFTKRIIGNGLMGYFLCQGWGNAPDSFPRKFMDTAARYFTQPDKTSHDQFIETLLQFKHWHYEVPLFPHLVVMDSRTRRWKRDRSPSSPSGLLDWEALMKLQHKLMKENAVMLVAPGPIFGVKLIELIQRLFTTFGYSLTVDAENWMSHRKSAYTLLEIFKNAKTASYNVIISGDVHYSFAYDVELRYTKNCPGIWQITSSGIKNQFPEFLLKWLDRINQVMYSPNSLLNRFTKRRDMVIHERIPRGKEKRRLISACGVGRVTLDEKGAPIEIAELYANGTLLFFDPHGSSRESK
ncbi:hypothetical protein SAMN02746065_12520 [Desulfocicer vacuolatum DSM 3385]|uniref:PhoD-like phosphatase n=1 Tax=Desulfocicer vacuolatum DSM 3385 TaxID=1121400 RepID=A0A1W2E5Q6_9BACT|nr:alkaline phosphatase family protein [Desulfocicer vacuolatum]SMD05161.1 hypothetical protein SAMN02746065_12520 [Desulfocicer vacuolatum DSM 3385]